MPTAAKERRMERKTIRISSKRQVTIPQRYFERLGFGEEAECIPSCQGPERRGVF